jgi:hypothetical protein
MSGRHVWRNTGWYAGASFAEADAAHPAPLPTSFSALGDDVSSRSLTIGKYVSRSTAVELSLEAAETKLTTEFPVFCVPGLCSLVPLARRTTTLETDSESLEISAFHVGRLGRLQYALSGGVTSNETDATIDVVETPLLPIVPLPPLPPPFSVSPPPTGIVGGVGSRSAPSARRERYTLAGELFPTRALGVRLGYARWDGDESLDESYELGATWFFKRSIGAQVVLARTKSPTFPIATVDDADSVAVRLIGRL